MSGLGGTAANIWTRPELGARAGRGLCGSLGGQGAAVALFSWRWGLERLAGGRTAEESVELGSGPRRSGERAPSSQSAALHGVRAGLLPALPGSLLLLLV